MERSVAVRQLLGRRRRLLLFTAAFLQWISSLTEIAAIFPNLNEMTPSVSLQNIERINFISLVNVLNFLKRLPCFLLWCFTISEGH